MNEELNVNEIAAAFLNQKLESIYEAGKDVLKGTSDNIHLRLKKTYKTYIEKIYTKHSKTKSFLFRTEPVFLYDFFVPVDLSLRDKKIKAETKEEIEISDILKISPYIVIAGTAGSGKSIFMRHLLLNSLITKIKVPIFIELRQFNEDDQSLMSYIENILKVNGLDLGLSYIEKALDAGHFILLLDGFDEIDIDKHKQINSEIREFTGKYSRNPVIISSRPDISLEGMPNFTSLNLNPLTLDQACTLIEKIEFDEDIKNKFKKDLKKDLYEKHTSFLSNPLLLSIMLLTYSHSADIPNKLNIFYYQAYEALFQRHDALKGAFLRKRNTKLDIQDFGKVFSLFCLQTYEKRQFQFSRIDALQYIETAKNLTRLEFKKEDFLKDALQAVCLLVEDGLQISFAHRSFQEYFTALYINNSTQEKQKTLIERYSKNILNDKIIILLYEMRPEIVECYYILPQLDKLKKLMNFKKDIGLSHYTRYLKKTYFKLTVGKKPTFALHINDGEIYGFINFTILTCGHLVGMTKLDARWFSHELLLNLSKHLGEDFEIDFQKLKPNDPNTKLLAKAGGFFSLNTIKKIFEIGIILEQQQKRIESSLDEILFKS